VKHPSMPVIFYTGQGSEEVAREAFKAGATDYFVKEAADFARKEKLVSSVRKAVEKCAVEAELAEKQAMLDSFIEFNPYSIIMTDSLGRPIRVNKAHTKLHGLSPGSQGRIVFDEDLAIPEAVEKAIQEEWKVKRPTYSLFTDENALKDEAARRFIRLWEEGETPASPTFWYTPPLAVEGLSIKPVCFGGTGFSIKDSRGEIKNYVLMHEDITARVEAEEAARQAHGQLEAAHGELGKAHRDLAEAHEQLCAACASVEQKVLERTAELAAANEKLEAANSMLQAEVGERARLAVELEVKNRELENFAHMVSHDLRNNLLVMQRLMEAATLPKADRESIYESLVANTENLRDFVERLLTLARAGKAIGHRMTIPVALVAEKAFAAAAAARDEAELSLEQPFPPVTCDPDAMEQVFFNLFTNALAHIPAGRAPRIEVRHQARGKQIEITVRDNGTGIPPGILPRIFDVTCTTGGKGRFGFGLAIVKKLVEAHGGTVGAENSGPGCGAAFAITLPR